MATRTDVQLIGVTTSEELLPVVEVVDSLESESTTKPLSANQGRVLKDMISGYNTVTTLTDTPVDKRLVVATIDSDQTMTLADDMTDGSEMRVIINNNGSATVTVTLPNGDTVDITNGYFAKVDIINAAGTLYISSTTAPGAEALAAVATLQSEDGSVTQYFDTCAEAATYATTNSSTNWHLTIGSGDIPMNCFRGLTNLISLTLKEGVTSISYNAFYNCSGFTGSLTIPDSVTSIGYNAFYNCSGFTGSLTIGNGVTTINNYAFYGCSGFTGSLTIPDSVTSISYNAFQNCSGFTGSLTIPDSVTSIGSNAFRGCSGFTGSLTIGNGVTTINNYAFYGCSGFTGSLTIPDSVTSISYNAFYNCSGFDDDLTYEGTSNPSTSTSVFTNTSFTVCKVPYDYADSTFCGLSVEKMAIPLE